MARRRSSATRVSRAGRREVDFRPIVRQDTPPMTAIAPTLSLPRSLGRLVLAAMAHVGRVRMMDEAWNIGVGSMFIVLLVSGFAGAVTALQAGYQFQGNLPWFVVGTLVTESIILELGPVLTALILSGRIRS